MNPKLLLIFAIMLFLISPVAGMMVKVSDSIVITGNETVNDDLYIVGGEASIQGTVNGDLIVVSGTVDIPGNVFGDLIVAGGEINLDGIVADDVRIAGGRININGNVGDDLIIGGGQVLVSEDADVKGSLSCFVGNTEFYGNVEENFFSYTGQIEFGGSVKGTATINSDSVHILSTARIDDDLNYSGSKQALIEEGAVIKGDVNFTKKEVPVAQRFRSRIVSSVFGFFSMLIVGGIAILIAPRQLASITKTLRGFTWQSLLLGLGFLILVPIVLLLVLITIIGIPIALLGLVLYIAIIYLSKVFVSIWIGDLVFNPRKIKNRKELFVEFVVGLIVLSILVLLPYVGWLFSLGSVLLGSGVLVKSLFFSRKGRKKSSL